MKKKVLSVVLMCLISGLFQAQAFALTSPPEIIGESAILIDAVTGDILYSKDMNELKEPASTTKIMTCLLALENLPLDKVLTIDAESPFTGGSKIYINEGEELTVEQLLYALMLESANDTAAALAIAISGSLDEFAALMNKRASELGAKRPSFRNPHGLHQTGHFATAYDLVMIAREAMKKPEFRKIVSTVEYTIPPTNKQPEARGYIYNTNVLLHGEGPKVPVKGVMTPPKYEGAIGIKTGYTPQAGGSLVSAAARDGTELIAVVLKSTEAGRFGDSIALLDYGFENFYTYKAVDVGTAIEDAEVISGAFNHVPVKILEDRYITLPKEASLSLITTKIVLDENITAPIAEGQQLGRVEIYEGSEVIGEVAVVAVSDIQEGMFFSRFGLEDSVSEIIYICAAAFGGLVVFIFIIYIILKIRYGIKRRAARAKRAMEIARERDRKQRENEQRRWPY